MIINYDEPIVKGGSFKWSEYALLREWNAYAIPTPQQYANAVYLFQQLQDLIRTPINKSLTISSGARTLEYVNYLRKKGIPAATKGAHNDWAAVDLQAPSGMTNKDFWNYCSSKWPGRMENLSATPTWVHLDTREFGSRIRFNP